MPYRTTDTHSEIPVFALLPHEERIDWGDVDTVPTLPEVEIGEEIMFAGDLLRVYKIVGQDRRGHHIEIARRLPEPEFVR